MLIVKATPDEILRIADRLEPAMREAFLTAFDTFAAQLSLNDLTDMLETGRLIQIIEMVRQLELPQATIDETQRILVKALTDAANKTGVGFGLSFDLTNPFAVRWAETQTGLLITEVTRETQKAVADIVSRGIVEGIPPRTQARSIRRIVGLTARDAAAVNRFLVGMLTDDPPMPTARAEVLADRMRNRLLRRRAENIARTETLTASNRGQYQAWQAAADNGLFDIQATRVVWIATEDDRLCPICAVLDGETVGFGETFVSRVQATGFDIRPAGTLEGTPQQDIRITGTKPLKEPMSTLTPPAHPSCRCTLGLEMGSTSVDIPHMTQALVDANVPPEIIAAITDATDEYRQAFPELMERFDRFDILDEPGQSMARAIGRERVDWNPIIGDIDKLQDLTDEWHSPRGTNLVTRVDGSTVSLEKRPLSIKGHDTKDVTEHVRRIARHELGHTIDTSALVNDPQAWHSAIDPLFDLTQQGTGTYGGRTSLVSYYGQEDAREFVAEAFADVFTFSEDALPISHEVVRRITELLP